MRGSWWSWLKSLGKVQIGDFNPRRGKSHLTIPKSNRDAEVPHPPGNPLSLDHDRQAEVLSKVPQHPARASTAIDVTDWPRGAATRLSFARDPVELDRITL